VLVHYGPSAGGGTGITWVGIITWVLQSLGVVEGEDERKRIKEAEGKSCSKSV
jgi:hypothetical protein